MRNGRIPSHAHAHSAILRFYRTFSAIPIFSYVIGDAPPVRPELVEGCIFSKLCTVFSKDHTTCVILRFYCHSEARSGNEAKPVHTSTLRQAQDRRAQDERVIPSHFSAPSIQSSVRGGTPRTQTLLIFQVVTTVFLWYTLDRSRGYN